VEAGEGGGKLDVAELRFVKAPGKAGRKKRACPGPFDDGAGKKGRRPFLQL